VRTYYNNYLHSGDISEIRSQKW